MPKTPPALSVTPRNCVGSKVPLLFTIFYKFWFVTMLVEVPGMVVDALLLPLLLPPFEWCLCRLFGELFEWWFWAEVVWLCMLP